MEAKKQRLDEGAGIEDLNAQEKLENITAKYDDLVGKHKVLVEKHEGLIEKHGNLVQKHDCLLATNAVLIKKQEGLNEKQNTLVATNAALVKKHDTLVATNAALVKKHEGLSEKYETFVQKLRDRVECPVCLVVPKAAPIPVCPNGHVVCVRCMRGYCPTCRVMMQQGKSTLAFTVIENIEHQCENVGCPEKCSFGELAKHGKICKYRLVSCPGPWCNMKVALVSLAAHLKTCGFLFGGGSIYYNSPQSFKIEVQKNYDPSPVQEWNFLAIKFDEKVFLLKVSMERGRWYFIVQMIGGEEDTVGYGVTIVVHRPAEKPEEGNYSKKYTGDVCPIDVNNRNVAESKDLCLALTDLAVSKMLVDSLDGQKIFSVYVNIFKKM